MEDWEPMKATTLKENVTNLLRRAIVDGTLPAGEDLNQAQIAERLGISRGPVREALGRLEQEGLIKSVPYKGVIVTPLTATYIRDLYSLRAALECFALRQGVKRRDAKDVDELGEIVDAMRGAIKKRELEQVTRLDLRFHNAIVRMGRNELLSHAWAPLRIGVERCLYSMHRSYASLEEVIGTHPPILDALRAGDADAAAGLLEAHILESGDHLCALWQEHESQPA